VCGAAHVQLGAHWVRRGAGGFSGGDEGRPPPGEAVTEAPAVGTKVVRLRAAQASPRGGLLGLRVGGGLGVALSGRCLTTLRGALLLPPPPS
jgi:hypothetical protein